MRLRLVVMTCAWAVGAFCFSGASWAQLNYFFQPTGTEEWFTDANWLDANMSGQLVPDYSFNERAIIDSGGTAIVDSTPVNPPPGGGPVGAIILGNTGAGSGTIEVQSGGTLETLVGIPQEGQTALNASVLIGLTGSGTLRVLPGGTFTSAGTLATGPNANDMVVAGASAGAGTATLNAALMTLNGTTQVFPNAAFGTSGNGNMILGATSAYTSEVNVSGTGRINSGGLAILNGTARLNFTGVTPSIGPTWTIAEADDFQGTQFDQVTTNATLAENHALVQRTIDIGGGRKQLRVNLEEALVLEVNRDNGNVKLTNPGTGPITFDSYFIGSDADSLVPGSFNGIQDQGLLGGNWVESDLRTDNVGEFRPSTDATFNQGSANDVALGAIFNPFSGAFGSDTAEDLTFTYSRFSTEVQVQATVKYSGTRVNNLLLQVDPDGVGDAYLRNPSQTTVEIDQYNILSASGQLSTSGWDSLDENDTQGAGVWLEALNNDANQLAEFNGSLVTPFLTLAPGAAINLGPLYIGTDEEDQDLAFTFARDGGPGAGEIGMVIYEQFIPAAPVPGDYNGDGRVDAGDYVRWRNNLNDPTEADINFNGDGGDVGLSDYAYWKARYGNPGAGGGGLSAAVPEPASWLLAVALGLALGLVRARNR